jgi:two-component system sensor histidine kinase EvgS
VAADMQAGTSPERVEHRGRFKILVVDDHPANRVLLQRQLAFLAFRCETAENGEAALALWRRGGFDLVITDCSMPVMDGYALTTAIRAIEQEQDLPRCPVLGCTAHVQEEERRRALDVGMDECLMKPIGLDALLEALNRHLREDVAIPAAAALPASEPKRATSPFDVHSLQGFSGGDAKIEASFLDALLRTNLSDMEELQGLARSGAMREAAACAHKIKGAARIVKADEVVRACEAVEAAGKGGDAEAISAVVATLAASLDRLNEAISAHLSGQATQVN